MDYLRNIGQQLRQVWQGMTRSQRFALALATCVSMALILGVGYWASQPDYRLLYSGLSAEDAGVITAKLQNQGIAFKLDGAGTTILVPADRVQQTRVELAVEGLPVKGGKGFELFDQSPLGTTPFTQHVNYMRALQVELAKTIMQIDPVIYARVHIVRPEPSPFVRDQKPTTASVMLKLRPGTNLTRNVGSAIISLVSRSVEGLAREHVTLVDANGRLLTEEQNSETGIAASQMDYRRELENYLAGKAETMLAQVLGPGRALVRVTADLNFQKHKEKKETFNPEARVITSEKITTTKSTSSTPGAKGPAGAASNLGRGGPSSVASSNNNLEESIQTEFAVSKVTQEFEDKTGNIERLTVAAMVDLSPSEKDSSGPLLNLADAQEIIKQAVGFKTSRDEIKVTNVKLNPPAPPTGLDEEWQRIQTWQNIAGLVRNGSLGIAALAALLLGWMILKRFSTLAQTA